MNVNVVESKLAIEKVFEIRRSVFVTEQQVPLEEEIDEFDTSDSVIHLLGMHNDLPVAASRIRFVNNYAKLERIAVLKEFRGMNFGAEMVISMEKVILNHNYKKAVLNAQTYAEGFYKKLGYTTVSGVFMDAGIPHITMNKVL